MGAKREPSKFSAEVITAIATGEEIWQTSKKPSHGAAVSFPRAFRVRESDGMHCSPQVRSPTVKSELLAKTAAGRLHSFFVSGWSCERREKFKILRARVFVFFLIDIYYFQAPFSDAFTLVISRSQTKVAEPHSSRASQPRLRYPQGWVALIGGGIAVRSKKRARDSAPQRPIDQEIARAKMCSSLV